jgi:hypothetical protein
MKIGSAKVEVLVWLALVAVCFLTIAGILANVHAAEQPPAYCDGMARPADNAECPPANPPKAAAPAQFEAEFAGARNARFIKTGGEICQAPGGDCVKWLMHNRGAYCVWGSDLAAVGAYFRRDKHFTLNQTLDQLNPQMKRPLTANEVKHIHYWLTWGWIVGGVRDEYETRKAAEGMCRRGEADGDKGEAGLPLGVGKES